MAAKSFDLLSKLHRLDAKQRSLLTEAAATLVLASAALRVLPFARAITLGAIALARRSGAAPTAQECGWAIEVVGRRLPWRTVCIHQGIAAQRMMRRNGVDARLHYGARTDSATGKLEAHVWVTVDGEAILGGEEAAGFAEVAAYP
jgi:hypothetical protein